MAMIDSNKLYRRIAGHSKYSGDAILTAISCLAEGKEIHDVPWLKNYVEVVWCKDCVYSRPLTKDERHRFNEYPIYCLHNGLGVLEHDFCSYGKHEDGD